MFQNTCIDPNENLRKELVNGLEKNTKGAIAKAVMQFDKSADPKSITSQDQKVMNLLKKLLQNPNFKDSMKILFYFQKWENFPKNSYVTK